MILHPVKSTLFRQLSATPKQMSSTTALCSFTSYEPWTCWPSTETDLTFSLTKDKELAVYENRHTRGRERILYLLVVDEKEYDSLRPEG
jgi:hypothetical protein